jgi:proteasome lid subunit RPN8/RPN11
VSGRLVLPPKLRAQLAREARAAFSRECCGLIEGAYDGADVRAAALHPARNLSSEADHFEIDPADHFKVLHAARERGRAIVGCYHSHPNGCAEPSPRDREGAGEAGFVWLIAALGGDAEPNILAFVFDGTAFAGMPIIQSGE